MKKIKTAVVGVGYLGHYHAEKYANLPQSEFIAVCDTNEERGQEIANRFQIKSFRDYRDLISLHLDAVSIVVPTPLHYEVASFFLDHGIHVLVEKPITVTAEQADHLITLAKQKNVLLQVGHLERFNNAIKAIEPYLHNPRFIESLRLSQFKIRGSDVNVVLDLMIHDIDIIQSIVKADIEKLSALGSPVLSPFLDIVNVRIEFTNGCVANVTANRVSLRQERKLRIFQPDSYISLDLDQKSIAIYRKGEQEMFPGIPEITRHKQNYPKGDALKEQIEAFLNSIVNKKPAVISGEDGKRALVTAIAISNIVHETNERFPVLA